MFLPDIPISREMTVEAIESAGHGKKKN